MCMHNNEVLTSGQIAKICRVAPRTVNKWIDTGLLRGYRIPGSRNRRVPRDQLIRFLKENGMPLGGLEAEGRHKILIVGAEPFFIERLKELLPEDDDFKYEIAHSWFEAGTLASSFHPDTIIIDHAMGRSESLQIASALRRNEAYKETVIFALASEDEPSPEGLSEYGFSEAFKKPFDVSLLGERLRRLLPQPQSHAHGEEVRA